METKLVLACMTVSAPWHSLMPRIVGKATRVKKKMRLRASMRHLHGPRRQYAATDDVTVVTVVKDGRFFLDEFFAHYRSMGVRHFVFVDNGSSDGTIRRIQQEPGTVVLQSALPTAEFEPDFRRYAAERYCTGRWCLYADIDELFDFEGREDTGLNCLIRYMNANGFTALAAQMLDLFPAVTLREASDWPFSKVLEDYRYFDLEAIETVPYHEHSHPLTAGFSYFLQHNSVPGEHIQFLFGGIRSKIFGEQCCLTKHPLVFLEPGVEAGVHPHCSARVRCADFTALLRHYKFCNSPIERDRQSVHDGTIPHGADKLRLAVLDQQDDLTLHTPLAQEYSGIEDLYDKGFLIRSQKFAAFSAVYAEG
ncbi:glycosyltransferase family 2 protein [Leisingera sp.]|uniref:glycosyltransferase family 2 protein n=1 Tax=Leisingera sp. TaxID=1879318 RepID=UPI002B275056|nr:glycosyltransferase family 2 protein [Leisingera sp.]